jgi:hypothetical protein
MAILDEADISTQRSHLFMLRLWLENLGDGHADWRGKVLYVNNGEACYFRDWQTLEAFMEKLFHKEKN